MKSLEDISILIKVKLFCLKKLFFGKSFYLKWNDFENKNMFLKKKKKDLLFWKKLLFEKKVFENKDNLFLKKLKKNFGKELFSPLVPKNPGT